MSHPIPHPHYPSNGNLRMYQMQPYRTYSNHSIRTATHEYDSGILISASPGVVSESEPHFGIDEMIAYVPKIAEMGYNAIWGGPFQATGSMPQRHPDGQSDVSGSLYAMADDREFNPLIFPGCESRQKAEEKLKQWTATVRLNGMFPLFDLVLNHVGRHAGDALTPLQIKLGADLGADLLLPDSNPRWPDIQNFDYYLTDSLKRGVNTPPEELDPEKIEAIFEILWKPYITRYITEFGFMGARIDAITHVPAIVQKLAYDLIKKLVYAKYGTNAIIVGELMVSNPQHYISALSTTGLTHCLNPNSFFWSPNKEGGYENGVGGLGKQNSQLSEIVMQPPAAKITSFCQLVIADSTFNPGNKLSPNTIYIYQDDLGITRLALNGDTTDICFGKALDLPLTDIDKADAVRSELNKYNSAAKIMRRDCKKLILQLLHNSTSLQSALAANRVQANIGGIIGVVGNHDVGTLKAKVMLDIAYRKALHKAATPITDIELTYKSFKDTIKGARDEIHLLSLLQSSFALDDTDKSDIIMETNVRMREKIFVLAMMCFGGWYSMAGDEFGICHKPDVFAEYAYSERRLAAAVTATTEEGTVRDDLRGFIRGVNSILSQLPRSSYSDDALMFSSTIEHPLLGSESSEHHIFLVSRYCALVDKHWLITYTAALLPEEILRKKIISMVSGKIKFCTTNLDLIMIDKTGATKAISLSKALGDTPCKLKSTTNPYALFAQRRPNVTDLYALNPPYIKYKSSPSTI